MRVTEGLMYLHLEFLTLAIIDKLFYRVDFSIMELWTQLFYNLK